MIYDIFGYSNQILQGADLLASLGFRVVMPDFLVGQYASPEMFSGTPEANEKRTAFFSQFPGAVPSQAKPVGDAIRELKSQGYSKIGSVGYCWGWKATMVADEIEGLSAIAGCHPSMSAPEDADKINVPLCLIPTSGEDMEVMDKIYSAVEKKLPGKNVFDNYQDQVHGFMAARADLDDEKVKAAYTKAYHTLAKFFTASL